MGIKQFDAISSQQQQFNQTAKIAFYCTEKRQAVTLN